MDADFDGFWSGVNLGTLIRILRCVTASRGRELSLQGMKRRVEQIKLYSAALIFFIFTVFLLATAIKVQAVIG